MLLKRTVILTCHCRKKEKKNKAQKPPPPPTETCNLWSLNHSATSSTLQRISAKVPQFQII